ncbi:MAG TPA: hypothetical protein VHZ75_11375 [Solirubrobacteraceae bacterium]|jgi:hypothetical protein|nr:hypothetical protein [Solirubrobacteraceae bacterium]
MIAGAHGPLRPPNPGPAIARRLGPALATVVVASGLAACGDSGGGGSAGATKPPAKMTAQALVNIADRTTATTGMHMSMHQTMTLGGHGTIAIDGTGGFDMKHRRGEMTVSTDFSSLLGKSAGSGAGKVQQRMVFDGFTFYVTSPQLQRLLPAGKHWMKFDLGEIGKQAGIDLGALSHGANQDPTQTLQYLKAASGAITRVGRETLRGEPTTHYKATVDFEKVPDTFPPDQRAAARASIRQIIALTGTTRVPIEVWVGDDGIARRMTEHQKVTIAGETTSIAQRIDLYDFGSAVNVQLPTAGDTADSGSLDAGSLSGGGSEPGAVTG